MQSESNTFQFLAGWVLLITILVLINRTRVGHVLIYYSLLLLIFFLIIVEYKQIAPVLASVQTLGQFNASQAQTGPTTKNQVGNI